MKGDFSRNTFDMSKHFSRVLMQQGRVQLDADWNEQASILLHYLQTLAADLIGPHGGPTDGAGFEIALSPKGDNLIIGGPGHYYVDGILCENEVACAYSAQPHYPLTEEEKNALNFSKGNWLVYLDVWERHITYLEDDHIREVALGVGGPDTATRAQVVWQVKMHAAQGDSGLSADERKQLETQLAAARATRDQLRAALKEAQEKGDLEVQKQLEARLEDAEIRIQSFEQQLAANVSCDMVAGWPSVGKGRLRARVKPERPAADPCITAPDSKYRGAENQLYRVEIHDVTYDKGILNQFTFKWSRDNGSIATAIAENNGAEVVVRRSRGFDAGQWVELTDDTQELRGDHGLLVKIVKVDGDTLTIEPSQNSDTSHATKVRRWDQMLVGDVELVDGAVKVAKSKWVDLEDGVQVQFEFEPDLTYRTGDYWLIPARVATGSIEWPETGGNAQWRSPHGTEHHYAPLATLQDGTLTSCRCSFAQAKCPPLPAK